MGWTDEYRETRSQAFQGLANAAAAAAASKKRRGDTRGVGLIHLHYLDAEGQKHVRHQPTELRRSGLYVTEQSHYGQDRSHPESAESKKDAEVIVASDIRGQILGVAEEGLHPYKVTMDVITNRGNCNRCMATLHQLADDVQGLMPAAEVKVNAIYERNDSNAMYSALPGRLNRETGQYRSQYGGTSAEPMHIEGTQPDQGSIQYYKDIAYPYEPDGRHGSIQQPLVGGAAFDSHTDESPYTTSTHESATTSSNSGGNSPGASDGSGERSEYSDRPNDAQNQWLPGASHPNVDWQWDQVNQVYYTPDYTTINCQGVQYDLFQQQMSTTEGTYLAYKSSQDKSLAILQGDSQGTAIFSTYPDVQASTWAKNRSRESTAAQQQGQSSSKGKGKAKR